MILRFLLLGFLNFTLDWGELPLLHPQKQSEDFRVISYNIGDAVPPQPSVLGVATVLEDYPVEVLYLQELMYQEFAEDLVEALEKQWNKKLYLHYVPSSYAAIISVYPLEPLTFFPEVPLRWQGAYAFVEVKGRRILLGSLHLPAFPKRRDGAGNLAYGVIPLMATVWQEWTATTERSRYSASILSWLKEQGGDHALLGGDLNTLPFSRTIANFSREHRDSLTLKRDFLYKSYNRIGVNWGPRADFIFADKGLISRESYIIKESPGDHFPVFASYAFK